MCMQCTVDAVTYGEVFPGWFLMRATNNVEQTWRKGRLALIASNDPTVVLTEEPVRDPYDMMTDEEVEEVFEENKDSKYLSVAEHLEGDFLESTAYLHSIYEIIHAATQKGYNVETSGRFGWWLSNYLAKWIEVHPSKPRDAKE